MQQVTRSLECRVVKVVASTARACGLKPGAITISSERGPLYLLLCVDCLWLKNAETAKHVDQEKILTCRCATKHPKSCRNAPGIRTSDRLGIGTCIRRACPDWSRRILTRLHPCMVGLPLVTELLFKEWNAALLAILVLYKQSNNNTESKEYTRFKQDSKLQL